MSTSNSCDLFIETSLKFQNENINVEIIPIPICDAKFGILNLNAASTPLTNEELEFIFMIDCSGSMSDQCSDGRNKIQHIIHTLKNMILYFKENPSIKVFITINSFDDKIYKVVEHCTVTDDNFNSIIAKIDNIMPRASTNIELALESIKNTAEFIHNEFPQRNIINIFMTDGEATAGNVNHIELASIVNRNITNAFIGFGIDHDTSLLNAVSNGENSSYYFIDKLENSGLVYGEILHGIVYKLLTNVEISVNNGLIYDFKNNVWVESISVGEIVSEANKNYHIISSNPYECSVSLKGKKIFDSSNINITISPQELSETENLTKYVYRQRTLQHLYKVSDFLKRKNKQNESPNKGFTIFRNNDLMYNSDIFLMEENNIREILRKFIEEMKKYMADNNINNDKFMKNLCDDIYISYRTFRTVYGEMYNNARQTSQGTQRCYTVSHTPDKTQEMYSSRLNNTRTLPIPNLKRQVANTYINNNALTQTIHYEDFHEDDINHVVSDFDDAPYLTPGPTQMMREISCHQEIILNDIDSEDEIEESQQA